MKPANWNNARLRQLVDNETPFIEIACPDNITIRLWWTTGGAYGLQVVTVIYGPDDGYPVTEKTNGCGYSKPNEAIEVAFYHIGMMPRGYRVGSGMPERYHVGGNYYRIPRKHWMKAR